MLNGERKKFHKLESHPDRDEIVRLISEGESPYQIDKILVNRYLDNKKLWLGSAYLYRYRLQEYPELTAITRRWKKMTRFGKLYEELIVQPCPEYPSYYMMVQRIIKEMKEEFPLGTYNENGLYPPRERVVYTWFEKWFGVSGEV